MEAAERAKAEAEAAAAAQEKKEQLDLDALDAAAAAQDPKLSGDGEIEPSGEDLAGELSADEFDRVVDAGSTEER